MTRAVRHRRATSSPRGKLETPLHTGRRASPSGKLELHCNAYVSRQPGPGRKGPLRFQSCLSKFESSARTSSCQLEVARPVAGGALASRLTGLAGASYELTFATITGVVSIGEMARGANSTLILAYLTIQASRARACQKAQYGASMPARPRPRPGRSPSTIRGMITGP